MKLSQLPDGESIFLDANIFLYSAFDHPTFGIACRDFLTRVDQEEVHGYCSAYVLNEVFHKLMMSEIVDKFGVQAGVATNLFKQRPEIISELRDAWEEMDIINNINITILDGQIFPEFVDLSKKYRLLRIPKNLFKSKALNSIYSI